MKTSVYIATSLDGYIAREDGALDWLEAIEPLENEDYGFAGFMASVDTLVMGRNTFDQVVGFGQWPYEGKRVIILSRSLAQEALPEAYADRVELHPGPIDKLIQHLHTSGAQGVYVDGGRVIQGFLAAGAIDELTLTRIPILLGSGIPLFGPLPQEIRLEHLQTRAYDNGLVQSRYRVLK